MADKKISELTLWAPLDTDIIPYVDLVTWETKKATKTELKWDKWDKWDTWDTWATWPQGIQWIQWPAWTNGTNWIDWLDWEDGRWITSITLISTVWKVKTYRITYTDATTFDYEVTDWADWTWAWDMLKSTYDTNNNGVVDNSEALNWEAGTYYLDTDNHTSWTINKVYTAIEQSKLSWIEEWAEVNTLNDVVAWTNISIDKTDPLNPIINSTWWWDVEEAPIDWNTYWRKDAWWEQLIDWNSLTNLTSTSLNIIVTNWKYCAQSSCTNLP